MFLPRPPGSRRARTHRSLRAEEVDKAARGRTPVDGGASGCFTAYGAQPGQSPRQLSRRITRAIVRSPRGRRTAAGVGEALLSALPPWRRGAWCGMTEPGVLASKLGPKLGIRSPRAASRSARPVSAFAPHTGRVCLGIHGIQDLAYLKTPAGAVCVLYGLGCFEMTRACRHRHRPTPQIPPPLCKLRKLASHIHRHCPSLQHFHIPAFASASLARPLTALASLAAPAAVRPAALCRQDLSSAAPQGLRARGRELRGKGIGNRCNKCCNPARQILCRKL